MLKKLCLIVAVVAVPMAMTTVPSEANATGLKCFKAAKAETGFKARHAVRKACRADRRAERRAA